MFDDADDVDEAACDSDYGFATGRVSNFEVDERIEGLRIRVGGGIGCTDGMVAPPRPVIGFLLLLLLGTLLVPLLPCAWTGRRTVVCVDIALEGRPSSILSSCSSKLKILPKRR